MPVSIKTLIVISKQYAINHLQKIKQLYDFKLDIKEQTPKWLLLYSRKCTAFINIAGSLTLLSF